MDEDPADPDAAPRALRERERLGLEPPLRALRRDRDRPPRRSGHERLGDGDGRGAGRGRQHHERDHRHHPRQGRALRHPHRPRTRRGYELYAQPRRRRQRHGERGGGGRATSRFSSTPSSSTRSRPRGAWPSMGARPGEACQWRRRRGLVHRRGAGRSRYGVRRLPDLHLRAARGARSDRPRASGPGSDGHPRHRPSRGDHAAKGGPAAGGSQRLRAYRERNSDPARLSPVYAVREFARADGAAALPTQARSRSAGSSPIPTSSIRPTPIPGKAPSTSTG